MGLLRLTPPMDQAQVQGKGLNPGVSHCCRIHRSLPCAFTLLSHYASTAKSWCSLGSAVVGSSDCPGSCMIFILILGFLRQHIGTYAAVKRPLRLGHYFLGRILRVCTCAVQYLRQHISQQHSKTLSYTESDHYPAQYCQLHWQQPSKVSDKNISVPYFERPGVEAQTCCMKTWCSFSRITAPL